LPIAKQMFDILSNVKANSPVNDHSSLASTLSTNTLLRVSSINPNLNGLLIKMISCMLECVSYEELTMIGFFPALIETLFKQLVSPKLSSEVSIN
jgi:hypothetical protein